MMRELFAKEAQDADLQIRAQMAGNRISYTEALQQLNELTVGHALPAQRSLKNLKKRYPQTYASVAEEYFNRNLIEVSRRNAIAAVVNGRIAMA